MGGGWFGEEGSTQLDPTWLGSPQSHEGQTGKGHVDNAGLCPRRRAATGPCPPAPSLSPARPRPLPYSLLCHVALLSTLAEQGGLRECVGPPFIAVLGTKPGPHGNVRSERTAQHGTFTQGGPRVSQGAARPGRDSRQRVAGGNSRAFCCLLITNRLSGTGKERRAELAADKVSTRVG